MKYYYNKLIEDGLVNTGFTDYSFIIDLVSFINPNVIVDLGFDFSIFSFCYSNRGQVYCRNQFNIDTYNKLHKIHQIRKIIKFNNIDEIKFKIDILHIDGKEEFNNWSKFLDDTSVVLFHDVVSFDELENGYKLIKEDSGLGIYTKDFLLYRVIEEMISKYK